MDIYILDKNLNIIATYDNYKSIIWSNRYKKNGDFEMYIPYTADTKAKIKEDNFIFRDKDYNEGIINRPKKIQKIELVENEAGKMLCVSGPDVSQILEDRVVYPMECLKGNVETMIYNLIQKHLVNPTNVKRKIDIFNNINTGLITDNIDKQITGDSLLKHIKDICGDFDIGYRTDLNYLQKKFVFKLYKGSDKTDINDGAVYISRKFDNLIKDQYSQDKENYKNMAIVAGAGEGAERRVIYINDDKTGLLRKELWVDARDIAEYDNEGIEIPIEDYNKQLKQRGSEQLSEHKSNITNACEADIDSTFVFNKDYFLGDVVICEGYETFKERIVETIESTTSSSEKTELTFEEVEEND